MKKWEIYDYARKYINSLLTYGNYIFIQLHERVTYIGNWEWSTTSKAHLDFQISVQGLASTRSITIRLHLYTI